MQFRWKFLNCLVLSAITVSSVAFGAAPSVNRPSPFPNYTVGDLATVIISTNPAQANAPVYRFRYKNGQPDGDQPTHIGNTGADGRLAIENLPLGLGNIGDYTNEQFAVGSPTGQRSSSISYSIHAASAPDSSRPWPYPDYEIGEPATNIITTSPAQANQPVYRYRYKNGLPDGQQGILIGHTNAQGSLTIQATPTAAEIGHYTIERFAVGTVSGPKSSSNNYYVHAANGPSAVRFAPFPSYEVGDTAVLDIFTSPAQANQKVYRYRYKDGSADGNQPTLIGITNSLGRLRNTYVLEQSDIGTYSSERFAVGTPTGPTSTSLNFVVSSAEQSPVAPTAERPAPFPDYQVGDTARLIVTTDPPQAGQAVYRYRLRDGQPDGAQPTHIGNTDASGVYDISLPLSESEIGTYSDERFAVGDPSGPTSAPNTYTVSERTGPTIDSISIDRLAQGVVTHVLVQGENLNGASVWVDGAGTLPTASVSSEAADGTWLNVAIDTTAAGIRGYFTLLVSQDVDNYDRAAFEVAPPGPAINGFTPPYPNRGQSYLLVIFGQNLGEATVTSSNPDYVQVLAPGSGEASVHAQPNNPPPVDTDVDGAIQGILQVAANAPLGPVQLLVENSQGATAVTLNITDGGLAMFANVNQINLTERATGKAGRSPELVPDLMVQDFHLDHQLTFSKTGRMEPHADCAGSASFRAFKQEAKVYALKDTGEALTWASLLLGVPQDFSVLTVAAYIDAEARLFWNCDPPWDESQLDWRISLGFEVVGLFSLELTVRPDNGRIIIMREAQSIFDRFDFGRIGQSDDCVDISSEPYDPLNFSGTRQFQLTQSRCCPGEVPISFAASIFQASPVASADLIANEAVVMRTEPEEEDCPCFANDDSPSQCPFNTLKVQEVSFEQDISIVKDQRNSLTPITDPVWINHNGETAPEKNEPVAYMRNQQLAVKAKFSISPALEDPFPVTFRAKGPDNMVFWSQEIQMVGKQVTVPLVSDILAPNHTKHYKPMTLTWEYCEQDPVNCVDDSDFFMAGQTRHEVYLTLDHTPTNVFLSVLALSINAGGATTRDQAAWDAWTNFMNLDVTTWDDRKLFYYRQGVGFQQACTTVEQLLIGTGDGGCDAFAKLLKRVLAVHGVASTINKVAVRDSCRVVGDQLLGDCWFLVGNFNFWRESEPSAPEYKWRMNLFNEGVGLGMVPAPPHHKFGDLESQTGIPGQNSPMPSEKVFGEHYVLYVPDLTSYGFPVYLDPSYGTHYFNELDFELGAVVGYGTTIDSPRIQVRKPRPGEGNIRFIPQFFNQIDKE